MKHTGIRPTVDKHTDLHRYKKDPLMLPHPFKPNLREPREEELIDGYNAGQHCLKGRIAQVRKSYDGTLN